MFSIWKGFLPFPPLTIRARRQSFGEPGTVNIDRVGKDSSYIYRQAKAILSRDETLLSCWLWLPILTWCNFWQKRHERELLYLFWIRTLCRLESLTSFPLSMSFETYTNMTSHLYAPHCFTVTYVKCLRELTRFAILFFQKFSWIFHCILNIGS